MNNTFDYTAARQARTSCNLSQAQVAKDLSISRSYLSQFESGKLVLQDAILESLEDYYLECGWDPEAANDDQGQTRRGKIVRTTPQPTRLKSELPNATAIELSTSTIIQANVRYGFVVPHSALEEDIESTLELLHANQHSIEDILNNDNIGELGILSTKDHTLNEKRLNTILLMAQNYSLIRVLQGYEELVELGLTDEYVTDGRLRIKHSHPRIGDHLSPL